MVAFIGYLASAILAISLMMSNALRFRCLNIAGNLCFITYGICIKAYPIIVANSILLSINIYQLVKLLHLKETFHHLAFKQGDVFIEAFLAFYRTDIEGYFPGFTFTKDTNRICFVVLRDLVIANIFIAKVVDDAKAIVEINYTVPRYRDFKVGRFIFEKEKEYLLAHNVTKIVYEAVPNKNHEQFITKMGFLPQQKDGKTMYIKSLT